MSYNMTTTLILQHFVHSEDAKATVDDDEGGLICFANHSASESSWIHDCMHYIYILYTVLIQIFLQLSFHCLVNNNTLLFHQTKSKSNSIKIKSRQTIHERHITSSFEIQKKIPS